MAEFPVENYMASQLHVVLVKSRLGLLSLTCYNYNTIHGACILLTALFSIPEEWCGWVWGEQLERGQQEEVGRS